MEDVLAIIFIFGGATLVGLGFSPIGRAIADNIRRKGQVPVGDDLRNELVEQREALREDLDAVRREVAELAERLDFAERLLAKSRETDRIGPGRS